MQELTYEGFAPGGVSVLVEAATDNPNRTTSEVKSLFNKSGARFAEPGAVAYMFSQVGEISVSKNGKSIDDIFTVALDAGAEDIEDRGEEIIIYVDPSSVAKISEKLKSSGIEVMSSEISRKALNPIIVGQEDKGKIINFLSALEDMDDVQSVYSNLSIN